MNELNISLIRGDTLAFGFKVEGVDQPVIAFFSVKRELDDTEYVLQKSTQRVSVDVDNNGIVYVGDNTYRVRVAPEETQRLEARNYYYDLEIRVNGDVYTPLKGYLMVEEEVTN